MAQQMEFVEDRPGIGRFVTYALLALLLLGAAWFIYSQFTAVRGVAVEAPPATVVDMLPPPPPPPPPPPRPVEETVEQPSPDVPVPNPEPAKAPDAPAPVQIDGPAQAGTDSFGVTSGSGNGAGAPGGSGTCLGSNCGTGNGGGGMTEAFYRRYLSNALQQRVQGDDKVNRLVFTADLSIVVSEGRVTQVSLIRSSGRDDRDQQLIRILQGVRGLDRPPSSLRFPQKITVRGRRAL